MIDPNFTVQQGDALYAAYQRISALESALAKAQRESERLNDALALALKLSLSAGLDRERLAALVAEKDAALEPFAREASRLLNLFLLELADDAPVTMHGLTYGDLRRARAARQKGEPT